MSTGQSPNQNAVALIAGPTASGKSDLAVMLALALKDQCRDAVIINADSAQVYADLQVLSARPTAPEMRGIAHKLFGEWDGARACSAADWAAAAKREIAAAHANGAVPILVGGTGLYIRTLLDGIAPIPAIDPDIRASVRAMPVDLAYAALQREDPSRAEILSANDSQRISRALEVVRSTGHTLAHWHSHKEGGIAADIDLHPLVLMPEREALYARCDKRFAAMMDAGAIAEVEALLARKLDEDLPVMRAIGVPEIAEALAGRLSMADAIISAMRATRNYAKRQYTWLKHQLPADWVRVAPENVLVEHHFERLL